MRTVRRAHPFLIHGSVASPDCLHCVIELPPGGAELRHPLAAVEGRLLHAFVGDRTASGNGDARNT
jgi:putative transposase